MMNLAGQVWLTINLFAVLVHIQHLTETWKKVLEKAITTRGLAEVNKPEIFT